VTHAVLASWLHLSLWQHPRSRKQVIKYPISRPWWFQHSVWTICYQGDELDKNSWSAGESTNTKQKDSDEKDKLGSEEDSKDEDNQEQDVMDKVEVEQDDKEEFEEDSDFNSTEL
jgi:hypothetical protein